MATGDNLKRDGRPSLLQIRYLIELKKLQPVKRGFQVVIAERCHVSRPGINKSLKKAIEQGLITQYYTFTDYGEEWIKSYENLIVRLEKYLDDAYLAHLPQVRVVHGRGTGALKAAVHRQLKKLKYVKEFRLGTFGEGDTGVTIVTFK